MDRKFHIAGIHSFLRVQQEAGFVFSGEAHPMPELTYVEQGQLHCVADGQDLLLQAGELAVFGPNQWHMQYADVGTAPRYVTVIFDAEGVDLTALVNRKIAASGHVAVVLQQMLQEQERTDDYSKEMILSLLRILILLLLREQSGSAEKQVVVPGGEHEIIRQAQQYVCSHVREKMTVPSVAKQVDVSPSYLTALFHKHLDISPGEYIRRVKLQESKQMIRENRLNFTEIAAALEYSTVHHYSRQFKEKFGITPSEYARSVR